MNHSEGKIGVEIFSSYESVFTLGSESDVRLSSGLLNAQIIQKTVRSNYAIVRKSMNLLANAFSINQKCFGFFLCSNFGMFYTLAIKFLYHIRLLKIDSHNVQFIGTFKLLIACHWVKRFM